MGIARAIRRVKRQAKQGGLNAVIGELGEGLRSRSVPGPLRGAARKLASIIDPTRAASRGRTSTPRSSSDDRGSRDDLDVPVFNARPPVEATQTGMDTGAEPSEPLAGMPVDASRVGATPEYNATPLEVAPLEVAPVDATPLEVTPIVIEAEEIAQVASEEAAESEPAAGAGDVVSAPQTSGDAREVAEKPAVTKGGAKKAGKAKPAKEKLASDGSSATSVARSGSKGAKKRPGPQASSKKK